jgi:hypothetical protein
VTPLIEAFTVIEINYPHVFKQLRLLWGSSECDKYFTSLIINTRSEPRNGFKPEVMDALLKLSKMHS